MSPKMAWGLETYAGRSQSTMIKARYDKVEAAILTLSCCIARKRPRPSPARQVMYTES